MKAQKLRTTLGVFERSKFFFSLPGTLIESIEAVHYFILRICERIDAFNRDVTTPLYVTTRRASSC